MILARDEKTRRKALQKLLPMQRSDFAGLFKAMDGFPVVIRTLDPPLHEFLPKRENLMVDLATLPYVDTAAKKELSARYNIPVKDLKKTLPELLRRVEELHEFNPMLGHRGCRLGVTYPEITEMQARAIFEAAVQVAKKGIKVIPEIMIPLIGSVEELSNPEGDRGSGAGMKFSLEGGVKSVKYMVGTMIEIPRAALTADRVATEAEFFSFGTNDLTQTTMGLSRDDYTKFQKDYEKAKIFKADPFAGAGPGRRRQVDRNGCKGGSQYAQRSRSRYLRRTRRRAEFSPVLLPDRHGLRFLFALSCPDRKTRCRAGRNRRP